MEAITLFWLIIIGCCILFVLHDKIIRILDEKMFLKISKGAFIKSVIFIGLILILYVTSQDINRKEEIEGGGKKEVNEDYYKVRSAFNTAQKEVERNLKAPSTAKFANEYDKESKYKVNDDGSVMIQSYVDTENSFGAKIRTFYRCNVSLSGEVYDLITW